jgi:hypothetical protein
VDERAILDRIIGTATLAGVAAAFTGSLEADPRYTWSATVVRKGHVIAIEGAIFCGAEQIGRFVRRLHYAKGSAQAVHEILEIDDVHRRRGIATGHYRKCVQFYDRVGIHPVTLDAADMGPFIWPIFGFDLIKHVHRERLRALLLHQEIAPVPSLNDLLAPAVVRIVIDGKPVGLKTLLDLARLTQGTLPMSLNLADPRQRASLEARGILEGEDRA